MQLPRSFAIDGFTTAADARKRRFLPGLSRPGIMISTEGETNTGKTEFALSCPGPGIVIAVDRGYDACLDNPEPPITRRDDFAFVEVLLSTNSQAADHVGIWKEFYRIYLQALANKDARTVVVDGDSDTWETQRLAEFGKLTQIMPIMYTAVRASRRVMINRAYDSGKIIIATNKLKDEYIPKLDDKGNSQLDKEGREIRVKSGGMVRQGFDDDNYLWSIQLRHLYSPAKYNEKLNKQIPQQWGIRVLKCKSNPGLIGEELWGNSCNFASLVQLAFPKTPLSAWGLSEDI